MNHNVTPQFPVKSPPFPSYTDTCSNFNLTNIFKFPHSPSLYLSRSQYFPEKNFLSFSRSIPFPFPFPSLYLYLSLSRWDLTNNDVRNETILPLAQDQQPLIPLQIVQGIQNPRNRIETGWRR